MAYADKSTGMRRMALTRGGHVQWEGVNVEGECLLIKRDYFNEVKTTMTLSEKELDKFIADINEGREGLYYEDLEIKYQDIENLWCPRDEFVKSQQDAEVKK